MAMCNGFTTKLIPDIHIEAVQSVTPFKITDPRPVRRVSVPHSFDVGLIFGQCLHILLYYTKATQEDSRWFHVGWIKESLARALLHQPIFAGRLREANKNDNHGDLEIVSNDSGIRLIEAQIQVTMSEFLDSKDREDAEAKLVFWKGVDEQDPKFSPLFFVQVTKFQCGGCSIGLSCSLLLADLLLKENFLKKWADIHNNMLSENSLPSIPIYYIPNNISKPCFSPTTIFSSNNRSKKCGQTMIFDINMPENVDSENDALQCWVEEAESTLPPKFCLFVKTKSCSAIKVEKFPRDHGLVKPKFLGSKINGAIWEDFGANEVEFREGNKAACVSHWVGFICGGLVMEIPSADEKVVPQVKVIVSVHSDQEF